MIVIVAEAAEAIEVVSAAAEVVVSVAIVRRSVAVVELQCACNPTWLCQIVFGSSQFLSTLHSKHIHAIQASLVSYLINRTKRIRIFMVVHEEMN